jgi:phosphatidylglycerophosphatase C
VSDARLGAPGPSGEREPAGPAGLAAWDFDGTITERDTLMGFLAFVAGRRALSAAAARRVVALGRGLRDDTSRDLAKERVIGDLMAGRPVAEVEDAGRRYAELLPAQFRPEALDRIRWHADRGHTQVIVSASLVYYLRPLAEQLGFATVMGVELAADDRGVCTGEFVRPNVRGEQKALRLREWLADQDLSVDGDRGPEIWAYGNSSGDDALLEMADHPTWMGRRAGRRA